jgi:hypothetical protein
MRHHCQREISELFFYREAIDGFLPGRACRAGVTLYRDGGGSPGKKVCVSLRGSVVNKKSL